MRFSATIGIRRNDWSPHSLEVLEVKNITIQELAELLDSKVGDSVITVNISLWNDLKLQLMRGERAQLAFSM